MVSRSVWTSFSLFSEHALQNIENVIKAPLSCSSLKPPPKLSIRRPVGKLLNQTIKALHAWMKRNNPGFKYPTREKCTDEFSYQLKVGDEIWFKERASAQMADAPW
jgi:hypothetical protein